MSAELGYDVHGPTDGDAPVLLLGSSVGTNRDMWTPQLSALSATLRVVRFEHRGHGALPVPPGPYTLDDLGSDVLALADSLGVQRFSYAGLSLGGMVGMWLGAHAPQRIDRLALCCTSAYLPPAQGWYDRAATVRASGMESVADAVVARWFTAPWAAAHPDVVADCRGMLTSTPPLGYAACCEAIGAMDLRDVLDRIVAPTLIIAATEDPTTPPPHGQEIADRVGGAARLEIVDGAHLATIENAPVCTELLLDHFRTPLPL